MKHLKYIVTTFAVALFAASCSQDELLEDGGDTPVTGQTQTYTFTVSPDIVMEGDAKTRSEGTEEEKPTRCFMQVFDNNVPVNTSAIPGVKEGDSYTFTITLASDKSYNYCFYADNGDANISDLRDIEWPTTGNVVAYAHKLSGKPDAIETSVTLKHIVTKITLKHIGDSFTVAANEKFKITLPCADTYNVLSNTAFVEYGYEEFTYTFAEEKTISNGDEVCSFYTIVPVDVESWSDITLNLHQLTQTISSIEWDVNSHITLQGDLSEGNPKWGATSEYAQKQIDRFFKDDNGNPKGNDNGDGIYCFNLPSTNINDLAAVIGAIFHETVEILLDNLGTIFDKELDNFNFAIKYNGIHIDININNINKYRICLNNNQYENFSCVSNELNQSTE